MNDADLHGVLPIWKPKGMSSKDVGRRLQKLIGKQKHGHVGTLDPLAEGVLPIVFGNATKLQDYLLELSKSYEFDVQFGIETTTLDLEGDVVQRMDVPTLDTSELSRILQTFLGEQEQIPPAFSAIKVGGKPLYKLARKNGVLDDQIEIKPRKVFIRELVLLKLGADYATIRVACSKGTYVRSIARDVGLKLGTVGTVTRLVRTSAAGFAQPQCFSVGDQMDTDNLDVNLVKKAIIPVDKIETGLPKWQSHSLHWTFKLRNGQILSVAKREFERSLTRLAWDTQQQHTFALYDECGVLFGIGQAMESGNEEVTLTMKRGVQ
jgi:tRNA pseudouridine55 synthase